MDGEGEALLDAASSEKYLELAIVNDLFDSPLDGTMHSLEREKRPASSLSP